MTTRSTAQRLLTLACAALACVALLSAASGCKVYGALVMHKDKPTSKTDAGMSNKDASMSLPDSAMTADGAMCVPTVELCNDKDDDCNGVLNDPAAVQTDCNNRIKHALSTCQHGTCVKLDCKAGYHDCDGDPSNGCEPCAACNKCDQPDAGSIDDAGRDDAN